MGVGECICLGKNFNVLARVLSFLPFFGRLSPCSLGLHLSSDRIYRPVPTHLVQKTFLGFFQALLTCYFGGVMMQVGGLRRPPCSPHLRSLRKSLGKPRRDLRVSHKQPKVTLRITAPEGALRQPQSHVPYCWSFSSSLFEKLPMGLNPWEALNPLDRTLPRI